MATPGSKGILVEPPVRNEGVTQPTPTQPQQPAQVRIASSHPLRTLRLFWRQAGLASARKLPPWQGKREVLLAVMPRHAGVSGPSCAIRVSDTRIRPSSLIPPKSTQEFPSSCV